MISLVLQVHLFPDLWIAAIEGNVAAVAWDSVAHFGGSLQQLCSRVAHQLFHCVQDRVVELLVDALEVLLFLQFVKRPVDVRLQFLVLAPGTLIELDLLQNSPIALQMSGLVRGFSLGVSLSSELIRFLKVFI